MSAYTWVATEIISTTGGSSVNYSLTVPSSLGAQMAKIQTASSTNTHEGYYTFDGTAPTSTNGKRLSLFSAGVPRSETLIVNGIRMENLTIAGSDAGVRWHADYYA